jgi:hypothetical protein
MLAHELSPSLEPFSAQNFNLAYMSKKLRNLNNPGSINEGLRYSFGTINYKKC